MNSRPLRPAKPEHVASKTSGSVFSIIDNRSPASPQFSGKPVEGGTPAPNRRLSSRLVSDGERTYRAYSADELIEIDSLAHHGRPGMPY